MYSSVQRICRLMPVFCFAIAQALFPLRAVLAQETDFEIPVLTIEQNPSGILGEPQEFVMRVVDNVGVERVSFFYRFSANDTFVEVQLKSGDKPDLYTAVVPTEGIDANSLQYYLLASDRAGNLVQRGYAFAPLIWNLRPAVVAGTGSSGGGDSKNTPVWVYLLGVVAVGALAAAAGGGGSSGDAGCGSDGCVLTITAPVPGN